MRVALRNYVLGGGPDPRIPSGEGAILASSFGPLWSIGNIWHEPKLFSRWQQYHSNLLPMQHYTHTHTHISLMALCPRLPAWAGTRNVKPFWHQLGRMQVCTSVQTDNHASTPPLSFYDPANSVKALKACNTMLVCYCPICMFLSQVSVLLSKLLNGSSYFWHRSNSAYLMIVSLPSEWHTRHRLLRLRILWFDFAVCQ